MLTRLWWAGCVGCVMVVTGCAPFVAGKLPPNEHLSAAEDPFFQELIRRPRLAPSIARGARPMGSQPFERVELAPRNPYQVGVASYYGRRFHGRRTAAGEVFDMWGLTAAHRALPLGTMLKVTNVENGRSVQVKVNDRGPYIDGRVLDLSYGAAAKLGMLRPGLAKVKIFLLDGSD